MARDHDRQTVLLHRSPYRARRTGISRSLRKLAIRHRLAGWNFPEHGINLTLKRRVTREIELPVTKRTPQLSETPLSSSSLRKSHGIKSFHTGFKEENTL